MLINCDQRVCGKQLLCRTGLGPTDWVARTGSHGLGRTGLGRTGLGRTGLGPTDWVALDWTARGATGVAKFIMLNIGCIDCGFIIQLIRGVYQAGFASDIIKR